MTVIGHNPTIKAEKGESPDQLDSMPFYQIAYEEQDGYNDQEESQQPQHSSRLKNDEKQQELDLIGEFGGIKIKQQEKQNFKQAKESSGFNDFFVQSNNIVIPDIELLSESDQGINNGRAGMRITGSVQLEGNSDMFLKLIVTNFTGEELTDFVIGFDVNSFGIQPKNQLLSVTVAPKQSSQLRVDIERGTNESGEQPECPFSFLVGLKCSLDEFRFNVNASYSVFLRKTGNIPAEEFQRLLKNEKSTMNQE